MHQITIESITKSNYCEWREVVTAANKAAASRKAYAIIRSTGEIVRIDKHLNQFDSAIEIWRVYV